MSRSVKHDGIWVGDTAPTGKRADHVIWIDTKDLKTGGKPVLKVYKSKTWVDIGSTAVS